MGNIATAAAATHGGGSSTFLIIIVVIFIAFYFLLIRPQRNKQRRVMEQQKAVRPGQRVRTTAGMYATVVAVDGDDVVLEVAPDVEVRYMKRAIMEVLGEGLGVPSDEAEGDLEAEDEATEAEPAYAGVEYADDEYDEAEYDAAAEEPAEPSVNDLAEEETAEGAKAPESNGHAGHPVKVTEPGGATSQE